MFVPKADLCPRKKEREKDRVMQLMKFPHLLFPFPSPFSVTNQSITQSLYNASLKSQSWKEEQKRARLDERKRRVRRREEKGEICKKKKKIAMPVSTFHANHPSTSYPSIYFIHERDPSPPPKEKKKIEKKKEKGKRGASLIRPNATFIHVIKFLSSHTLKSQSQS